MMTLGIDPGLTGALALLDAAGQVVILHDLPTLHRGTGKVKRELDPAGLAHLLRPHAGSIALAVVEGVASRPGQGVASMFSLGHSLGVIHGVMGALCIPWQPVTPSVWKKAAGLSSDKEAARAQASKLFPDMELHRIKDHNRAEALLIARYGLSQRFTAQGR